MALKTMQGYILEFLANYSYIERFIGTGFPLFIVFNPLNSTIHQTFSMLRERDP
jgi:hypothetical protein